MNLKYKGTLFALVVVLLGTCTSGNENPVEVQKPMNYVIILADDLGYGDVSFYNPESKIKTPNIDALAEAGIAFTNGHTTSSVCSPTRYSLLTGRYNWRSIMKSGVLWSYSPALIKENQLTIGSLLQNKGYTTGCVGKWHLGWDWDHIEAGPDSITFMEPIKHGPTTRGFDYFFGIKASLDIPPYVYVENDMPTAPPDRRTEDSGFRFWRDGLTGADFDHEQVLPTLRDKAVGFIRDNADNPFFLYFPLPAPHTPILPTEKYQGSSGLSSYGDFVVMVDAVVGDVMSALEDRNLLENTMVIFVADNGCSPAADIKGMQEQGHFPSYVFRGHKADIFEGGHRVPFIVHYPGGESGKTSNELVSTVDFLATIAEDAGLDYADNEAADSYSFLSTLVGHDSISRQSLVHHSIDGEFAIRRDEWKLILTAGSGGWSYPRKGANDSVLQTLPDRQLYNMNDDPGETQNLILDHPQLAVDLETELKLIILQGRSTPGPELMNDPVDKWPQISFID